MADLTRRIGLFGGTFDPPHLGHLALGTSAWQALALDELRWLPAHAPWQKAGRGLASGEHRVAMLRALLQGQAQMRVDERELRRGGTTYTVDTVNEVTAEQPSATFYLLIGQDQFARFDSWHRWQDIVAHCQLAVASREGAVPVPPAALAAAKTPWVNVPMPRMDISASEIRTRLAAGQSVEALAGNEVARYIAQHMLYQSHRS